MQQPFNVFRVMAVALAVFVGNIGLAATLHPALADRLNEGAKAYSAGDFAAAAGHWRPLAEAGDALAQFNLALLHDSSQSGLFDSAGAAKWYKRAALQGFAAAQYNLAVAYQNGRGVAKDGAAALFWLLVAAEAEDRAIGARAADAARQIGARLDEDERAAAALRANQWRPAPEKQTSGGDERDDPPYMTLSEADVMMIQRRLKALGFDPGPVDGIAGEATQRAIAAFLGERGMEWRHGPLSHRLLEILR